jgi:hypothetical protein
MRQGVGKKYVIALIGLWVLASIAKYKFNGLILGLDFGLYHPDGAYYAFRTLTFLGHDHLSAAQQVSDWYIANSTKKVEIPIAGLLPETSPAWGLVFPRILYPVLSMPFVAMLGIPGTLVVPALSLLSTMLAVYYVISKRNSQLLGFSISLLLLLSPTVIRWSYANCTDALLMSLFALVPVIGLRVSKYNARILMILFLVALTSLTRFCAPIWIAIGVIFWICRWRRESIITIVSSALSAIPIYLLAPKTGFLPLENDSGFLEKVLKLPVSMLRVGFYEVAQLWVLDRVLFFALAVAVAVSLFRFSWDESKFFLAVTLASWFTGGINGVIGVNFRYQLPLIPFMLILLARFVVEIKPKVPQAWFEKIR